MMLVSSDLIDSVAHKNLAGWGYAGRCFSSSVTSCIWYNYISINANVFFALSFPSSMLHETYSLVVSTKDISD